MTIIIIFIITISKVAMNINIKDQLPLPPALAKLVQTFSVIQHISFPVSSAGIPPERSLGVHRDIPKREERVVCDYIRRNPPSTLLHFDRHAQKEKDAWEHRKYLIKIKTPL